MLSAQRLTTLSSRAIASFAIAFLLHAHIQSFLWWGFVLLMAVTPFGTLFLLFLNEYNPIDDSKAEKVKAERANFAQMVALGCGCAFFIGGLMRWLN